MPYDAVLQYFLFNTCNDCGQLKNCGCMLSKDISAYNTCPQGCAYCYAKITPQSAIASYLRNNPDNDSII
ncbi:MAG: DUF1848 domain-containing protein [Muribaculum sp.]|nr:DUF1848 domain-containing protein [Muribaculaceae bacterium]MCM1080391.1 DUF1848 domain-containing protein [Muribaculum sp.]